MPGKMTVAQFDHFLSELPEKLEAGVVRGLQRAAMRGVGRVVGNLQQLKVDDTGGLRQSVRYQPLSNGGAVLVEAPHAPFIEYGTRPHMPPLEPLIRWVERKLRPTPKHLKAPKAAKAKTYKTEAGAKKAAAKAAKKQAEWRDTYGAAADFEAEQVRQIALQIAFAIRKNGTKPKPYFGPAMRVVYEDDVPKFVKQELDKVLG